MRVLPTKYRLFWREEEDFPALNAALFVLLFLFAALLSFGAFSALVCARIIADALRLHEMRDWKWRDCFRASVRLSLPDLTLLAIVGSLGAYLHGAAWGGGGVRAQITVVRAIAWLVPAFCLLWRQLRILLSSSRRLHAAQRRRHVFSSAEHGYLRIVAACAVVLLAAPSILGIPAGAVGTFFWTQLSFWRR